MLQLNIIFSFLIYISKIVYFHINSENKIVPKEEKIF